MYGAESVSKCMDGFSLYGLFFILFFIVHVWGINFLTTLLLISLLRMRRITIKTALSAVNFNSEQLSHHVFFRMSHELYGTGLTYSFITIH